jgi:hypothetical protein
LKIKRFEIISLESAEGQSKGFGMIAASGIRVAGPLKEFSRWALTFRQFNAADSRV